VLEAEKAWVSRHRIPVIIVAGVVVAVAVVRLSPVFQECVGTNQPDYQSGALYQLIAEFVGRLWWCGGIFSRENGGAITAFASVAIGVFTLTLWRATNKLWEAGEKQSKILLKSADAVIAAERARFHVVIQSHNLLSFISLATMYDNSGQMPTRGDISIHCHFTNYGRGPGLIREISYGMHLSELPPEHAIYSVVRQAPREYMVPSLGTTERYICESTQMFDSLQSAIDIRSGRLLVWFFGRFDYVDFVTNSPQVHRFLMRYIQTESGQWRFQTFDYKNYNQST